MISLKNIAQEFHNGTERNHVLKCINLDIPEGQFITVIGGNGAGKSTLFNIINGNLRPTSGAIFIDGKDVVRTSHSSRAAMISRVYQDPNFGVCPELTIAENMALANARGNWKWLRRAIRKKDIAFFEQKLAEFELELETMLRKKASLLSGGQRQVLTLLMATLQKPRLLLLDEHTAALDPKIAKQVMGITKNLVDNQKITTIMISHNMSDAITYGDRLIMLRGGEIVMDVSGEEKQALTPAELITMFELDA
ncbi:MAG: ATP-binding cassette domain-containing protein [Defluviitaleaceae bacterium]|nr:ATP-binding cassette domain-containing protein [Defluviitaleaceae bacterium]